MAAKKATKKKAPLKGKAKGTKSAKHKKLTDEELVIPKVAGSSYVPTMGTGLAGTQLKSAMREFIAGENKEYDHKVIEFASNVPNTYELRRPSGIMQLDIDCAGGLPAGGLSYVSGPDNAGKTFLILLYMLMHQRLYGDQAALAFACVEGGFDFKRALNMGLKIAVPDATLDQWDKERTQRGWPPYTKDERKFFKEQTGEFLIIGGRTGEETLQTTLNAIRRGIFGIVAVDSVSILLPDADADKDLDENNKRAANASLITDFIRQYTPLTSGLDGLNYTTLIFSSQVRSNSAKATASPMVQKYMKDWASTGAYAGKHGKLIDICVWSGGKIDKVINGKKAIIGKHTKYELLKGKAGAHDNVTGEFPFYYDSYYAPGIDRLETVLAAGENLGVIRTDARGMVSVHQPETGDATDIQGIPGMNNFRRMLEIDIDLEEAVRMEVLAAYKVQCLYR